MQSGKNSPLLISLSLFLLCPEMLFFCAVQSAVSCVIFFLLLWLYQWLQGIEAESVCSVLGLWLLC